MFYRMGSCKHVSGIGKRAWAVIPEIQGGGKGPLHSAFTDSKGADGVSQLLADNRALVARLVRMVPRTPPQTDYQPWSPLSPLTERGENEKMEDMIDTLESSLYVESLDALYSYSLPFATRPVHLLLVQAE